MPCPFEYRLGSPTDFISLLRPIKSSRDSLGGRLQRIHFESQDYLGGASHLATGLYPQLHMKYPQLYMAYIWLLIWPLYMSLVAFPCNFHPTIFLTFHSFVNWVVISFRSLPCSPQTPKHGPGLPAWWCNNHLEKYEFVNRKDYPIYEMENKKHVPNHQPVICLTAYVPYFPLNQSIKDLEPASWEN